MNIQTLAIVMRERGGPEVLRAERVEVPAPGPTQVRIRQTYIGVNYHDVYVRSGLYSTMQLPGTPGIDAAGVVESVGSSVEGLSVGDRVAYVTPRYGAYAEVRVLEASDAIRIPEWLGDREAVAGLLRGLTVAMLVLKCYAVRQGTVCLVHAAAGGVGSLLVQWAKHLGATVIGTVGSEAKAEIAKRSGCDTVIYYRRESVLERVRELTSGRGVDVAYDAVGKDTFAASLACLATRGHLVCYGQSSGPVGPFAVSDLAGRSLTVSRPVLFHYISDLSERRELVDRVFGALQRGVMAPGETTVLPLGDAAEAHRLLEGRGAAGSLLLRAG